MHSTLNLPVRGSPVELSTGIDATSISSEIFLKIAAPSLAQEVGIVGRWADRNGFGSATKQIAQIVCLRMSAVVGKYASLVVVTDHLL